MNVFSPAEIVTNLTDIGHTKVSMPAWKQLLLGILAGFLICCASAVTNMATHAISNTSVARILSGLLFPFGLGMVMLVTAELFTGNCLIPIAILNKKATLSGMLKNWCIVFVGNFIGGMLISSMCALSGYFDFASMKLAVQTISVAAAKCSLPFGRAFVLGVLCNLLVCMGVICSLSAKDTIGRILGAYIPVCFFVLCGFEHSIANMYYVPAGLLAMLNPSYVQAAIDAGVKTASLSWGNFFSHNLLPVTLGNILGGVSLALLMWACYQQKVQSEVK